MTEPKLVVACGLPGVGKTTVSRAIADRVGAEPLRTDVLRKELYETPTYASEETDGVYETLFERASERLADGEGVVLDGTFRRQTRRDRARTLATELGVDARFVHVTCEESTVRERLAAREDDESDADFGVYRQLREEFEPFTEPPTTVDNSGTLEWTREQVRREFTG